MKSQYNGTQATEARPDNGRRTIVRTGHPALDAALAVDRTNTPDLVTLQAGCRRAAVAASPLAEGPAVAAGALGTAMSLTHDRDGAGTTMHVASKHGVVDARGRSRTISVWHELGTQSCN